ncbi:MAG: uroporphyrinogen-III C-methyltransferase [Pseudomonadota bacterium]
MSDAKSSGDQPEKAEAPSEHIAEEAVSEDAAKDANPQTTPAGHASDAVEIEVAAPEPASDPEPVAQDEPQTSAKKSGGGLIKLLTLAVVLIAVAALVYFYLFREAPTETASATSSPSTAAPTPASAAEDLIPAATVADIDRLNAKIDVLSENLGELSQAMNDSDSALQEQRQDTQRLKTSIEERVDLLDSLPGRVRNTEDALVTLQGISAGSRNAWLLAEAEYYMQIANAQVQLANNPALGAKALELADQRVRELGDPAYTAVRRELATELATLNAINKTDIEGVTLTLGSLASMVGGLPLANEIRVPKAGDDARSLDDLTGWERAKATVNQAASTLFRIRRSDTRVEAMLSPEAEYFLRLNLELQLQAARLSLLLGETASYQQSLQDAEKWLRTYFDNDDPAVGAALEMLIGVADANLVSERPDISGSLNLLRQQRNVGQIAE